MMLTFIKLWWKPLLAAFVVAGAAWYVIDLNQTITNQRVTLAELRVENEVVKENNAKLTASIGATNSALEKLSDGADETQKAFAKLNSNVVNQLSGLDGRLKRITAETKPVTCEDTIRYLIDAVKDYQ